MPTASNPSHDIVLTSGDGHQIKVPEGGTVRLIPHQTCEAFPQALEITRQKDMIVVAPLTSSAGLGRAAAYTLPGQ